MYLQGQTCLNNTPHTLAIREFIPSLPYTVVAHPSLTLWWPTPPLHYDGPPLPYTVVAHLSLTLWWPTPPFTELFHSPLQCVIPLPILLHLSQ